jgi:WhiB family transcriptional regulator, redox-sensing transcriptional regulator
MIRTMENLPIVQLFKSPACAEIGDPDYFFPESKLQEAERLPNLRKICGACIERKECLAYAIKEEIQHGIWGGKTPSERGQNLDRDEIRIRNERVIKLRNQGISTDEIAKKVGIRVTQIYRIFSDANKARKREDQSNQIQNTEFAASSSSLESQR